MIGRPLAALVMASALLAGCGDDGPDAAAPPVDGEVAACDDLRRRENELIAVANEALADVGDATDDRERHAAVLGGFDRLAATAAAQEIEVAGGDPAVHEALVAGAAGAVSALESERARFLSERADLVTAADERGVAGQLQNALEKAFSEMEPPRSVYRDAGLAEGTDADRDCRFVTPRGDPSR